MILACLLVFVAAQPHGQWQDIWSTNTFRADPTGPPNHRAQLAWYVHKDGSIGDMKLSFYTAGETPEYLETCTIVGHGLEGRRVEVFRLFTPGREPRRHDWGSSWVVAHVTGNGKERALVWYVDGHVRRPFEELNLHPCDTALLDYDGLLTEHARARDLDSFSRPHGLQDSSPVSRTWTYDGTRFNAAPWTAPQS